MTIPRSTKRLKTKYQVQLGFTLIELLVVITIIGVIAVWGIPQFGQFTARKQVDNAVIQVVASLKMARSQAMTSGRAVTLCGLDAGRTACAASAGDWSAGWGAVATGPAGNAEVLQVYEAPSALTITAAQIVVQPNGMRTGVAAIVILIHPTNIGDGSLDQKVTINAASLSYTLN